MKTFIVDSDKKVTVFATASDASNIAVDANRFSSEEELAFVAAKWPINHLVEIWNRIPGLRPVKKFMDRKTAVHRIWRAVQQLSPAPALQLEQDMTTAMPDTPMVTSRKSESKKDAIVGLLNRTAGATLEDLMTVTGWQAHSVRGFISGTVVKKLNLTVESVRKDGHRVYFVRP
jgi:hypothetical protein